MANVIESVRSTVSKRLASQHHKEHLVTAAGITAILIMTLLFLYR